MPKTIRRGKKKKARSQHAKRRSVSASDSRPPARKSSRTAGRKSSIEDFTPKTGLPGKIDSGPEPDVFGREVPPQD
jgi:hypothetical protein